VAFGFKLVAMKTTFIISAAQAIHRAILDNEAQIESLDRAIGDGDHYLNMKRGCEAVVAMSETLQDLPPDAALQKIGMTLLSSIGGSSGPLFASLLMGMAKFNKEHHPQINETNLHLELAATFAYGVQSMMQRGKSNVGEKTMLDVLVTVSTTFSTCVAQGNSTAEICKAVKDAADKGLEYTRDLVATKGRAAALGERAIGHLDAGAKSCQVMTHAVCDLILNAE
jgi:dihydroxyacetone kinase-like protein